LARRPWLPETPEEFVSSRSFELTYVARDLEAFARDCGFEGPPFHWLPERRAMLRAELDALFLHLYELSRDDASYILDTFPIVRRHDEERFGEYRTKRLVLERYDAMSKAKVDGTAYRSELQPPPPRVSGAPKPSEGVAR
jgi:hypothetical protein